MPDLKYSQRENRDGSLSSEEKPELTFGDRVVNTLVGATLGSFVGGGVLAGGAAIYGEMAGLIASFLASLLYKDLLLEA